MSEFGLKIKNIEAATLYEYNKGLRDHYEYKEAMFVKFSFICLRVSPFHCHFFRSFRCCLIVHWLICPVRL